MGTCCPNSKIGETIKSFTLDSSLEKSESIRHHVGEYNSFDSFYISEDPSDICIQITENDTCVRRKQSFTAEVSNSLLSKLKSADSLVRNELEDFSELSLCRD